MLNKIILGFGSNVGNRELNIYNSLKILSHSDDFLFIAVSRLYETEPWGYKSQREFLNCVAVFLYRSKPEKLLTALKKTEKAIGRNKEKKWYPREIDIDILFFENLIINSDNLFIPHPFIHKRNFVLKPLTDLIPDYLHPVLKKKVSTLYQNTPDRSKCYIYKNRIIQ